MALFKFVKLTVNNKDVVNIGDKDGAENAASPPDAQFSEKKKFGNSSVSFSVTAHKQDGNADPKVKARANVIANVIILLVLLGMVGLYLLFR